MAYFDTHAQKVDKIDAPLLVVGLGGTGADGVLHIKSEFGQRFKPDVVTGKELDRPPRTAYLVVDTDPGVLGKRYHGVMIDPDAEWVDLSCQVSYVLGNDGKQLDSSIKKWLDKQFYTDSLLIKEAATNGAGTYRQLSRMMLFRKSQDLLTKLKAVLTDLSTVPAGAPVGATIINVVVVTGLSGGTGSGTFLDFAYLLRYAAKTLGFEVRLDLYAVAPDVTINRQAVGDPVKATIYKTNSFAALKEMDYWLSFDKRKEGHLPSENPVVDYGSGLRVTWESAPYDDVTLLCATNAQGHLLEGAYNVVMNSMAETLLFMMASEANRGDVVNKDNTDYSDANDSYSFQSSKSNEYAYRQAILRPYPQSYSYRAIGAYSNLGEQRNKISIEADLLFQDIGSFNITSFNELRMDGALPDRFFEPIQTLLGGLQGDFLNATCFDEAMFSGFTPWSQKDIKVMPPESAPDGICHDEWLKIVKDRIEGLSLGFARRLKDKFIGISEHFILENGPDALKKMLDDPDNGYLKRVQDKALSFSNQADNYRSEYNQMVSDAKAALLDFQGSNLFPNPFEPKQKFERYIALAREVYISKQNEILCNILADVFGDHANEVRTQISDRNLKFAIQALKDIQKDVSDDVKSIPVTSGDMHLLNLDELRKQIKATYEAENNREKLRTAVMSKTASVALTFDTGKRKETAVDDLYNELNGMIDSIYHEINDMTLQHQLIGFNGLNDNGVASYVQQNIAPQLERGAQVHFAVTPAYGGLNTTNAVLSSYISIPANAEQVKAGIKQYVAKGKYSGSVIKNSNIDDRIFWMNIIAGLPLCAYSFLADYEQVYEENKKDRPGTHLVTMSEEDLRLLNVERTMENDWNLLPSPNPFRTLGAKPVNPLVLERWEKTEKILTDAHEAGCIEIDTNHSSVKEFVAKVKLFRNADGTLMTADTLKTLVETAKVQGQEALVTLLNSRFSFDPVKDPRASEQAEEISKAYNLAGVFSDDKVTQAKCFTELVYYRLSQRPLMVSAISKQIPLIKEVRQCLSEGDKVKDAISDVSKFWLYDMIKMKLTSVLFKDGMGEFNALFGQNEAIHTETWANYIPLEARLVEWYAQQDTELEPFATMLETTKELYDHSMDPDDTDEDLALCRGYKETAEKIIAGFKQKIVSLKAHQKDLPRDVYDQSMRIMNGLDSELKAISSVWMSL